MSHIKQVGLYLNKETISQINQLAGITYRKKSDLMRMWIEQGVQRMFYEIELKKKQQLGDDDE